MATTAYDIIKRPIITEQSMGETENKKYTFEVAKDANKIQIAKAVGEGLIAAECAADELSESERK